MLYSLPKRNSYVFSSIGNKDRLGIEIEHFSRNYCKSRKRLAKKLMKSPTGSIGFSESILTKLIKVKSLKKSEFCEEDSGFKVSSNSYHTLLLRIKLRKLKTKAINQKTRLIIPNPKPK